LDTNDYTLILPEYFLSTLHLGERASGSLKTLASSKTKSKGCLTAKEKYERK
jgi:hypothetical protein